MRILKMFIIAYMMVYQGIMMLYSSLAPFTLRRRNLETQKSPVILDLCLRKIRSGKSHEYRNAVVFKKLRSVHTKAKSRRGFQISPVWRTFSWRVNVDGRLNRRNKPTFSHFYGVWTLRGKKTPNFWLDRRFFWKCSHKNDLIKESGFFFIDSYIWDCSTDDESCFSKFFFRKFPSPRSLATLSSWGLIQKGQVTITTIITMTTIKSRVRLNYLSDSIWLSWDWF